WVATAGADGAVRLWEATGEPLQTLRPPGGAGRGRVQAVALSRLGHLAAGGEDRMIRIWDGSTGRLLHTLRGHEGAVRVLAFSPRGDLLASGGEDRTVRLWDVGRGRELRTFQGPDPDGRSHQYAVRALAFSPDGRRLASGSEDHTAQLWDLATGQPLLRDEVTGEPSALPHHDSVKAVAFSPDGARLLTGS